MSDILTFAFNAFNKSHSTKEPIVPPPSSPEATAEGGKGVLDFAKEAAEKDKSFVEEWAPELDKAFGTVKEEEEIYQPEIDSTASNSLLNQLVMDESSGRDFLSPYKDSVGKLTIGHGFNLDEPSNANIFRSVTGKTVDQARQPGFSISKDEQMSLLRATISVAEQSTNRLFKNLSKYRPEVQDALVNFVFNLGETKAAEFKNTIAAFERGDSAAAARGLRNSKWAKQVGARADRIIAEVEKGIFPKVENNG